FTSLLFSFSPTPTLCPSSFHFSATAIKANVSAASNPSMAFSVFSSSFPQGIFAASSGASLDHHGHSVSGSGGGAALAFDIEYARWIDENQRLINDLRTAVNSQMGDNQLRILVDGVMDHYDEIFRLMSIVAKADVRHVEDSRRGMFHVVGWIPLFRTCQDIREPAGAFERSAAGGDMQSAAV
ncbi:unnamed protein product, partial [Linum tenue]